MNGRQQVASHQARIDAVFARAKQLELDGDPEIRSDMARYLCVVVSGFLEKAVSEMLLQHARTTGAPSLQRFVEANTGKFTNANCQKLVNTFGSFDPKWQAKISTVLVNDLKDAVDSIVANRHLVVHGGTVGLTYTRMLAYYQQIKKLVDVITDICDPRQ